MPSSPRPPLGRAVQLFATCIVEHVRPQVGLAVVRVLERLGVSVHVPAGLTCCGQPAFNAGARRDARLMAQQTVDVLSQSPLPIVVPSGSCTDMIAHQVPVMLRDDPAYAARAAEIAARTWEFSEAVAHLAPTLTGSGSAAPAPVTYHPSCHLLRGLGIRDMPLQLIDACGIERVDLPGAEECCGFGGLFSLKMSEISGAMLARKLDHVRETGARTLVACDASCLLHLEGGLRKRGDRTAVQHLAELLDGCAALSASSGPGDAA